MEVDNVSDVALLPLSRDWLAMPLDLWKDIIGRLSLFDQVNLIESMKVKQGEDTGKALGKYVLDRSAATLSDFSLDETVYSLSDLVSVVCTKGVDVGGPTRLGVYENLTGNDLTSHIKTSRSFIGFHGTCAIGNYEDKICLFDAQRNRFVVWSVGRTTEPAEVDLSSTADVRNSRFGFARSYILLVMPSHSEYCDISSGRWTTVKGGHLVVRDQPMVVVKHNIYWRSALTRSSVIVSFQVK